MSAFWTWLAELVVLVGVWMLLVFKNDLQDLVSAVVFSVITVAAANVLYRAAEDKLKVPRGWFGAIAKLPVKLIKDSITVCRFAMNPSVSHSEREGLMMRIPFDQGGNGPTDEARLGIVETGISLTPNTVVVDSLDGSLLIHQLVQTPVGAERRDPRWPV